MEFHTIFLTDELITLIYENLSYHDKISFSHINQYSYQNYSNAVRYLAFDLINKDYKLFKEWMHRYRYTNDEIKELGIKSILGVRPVWGSIMCGYYDLRYIFELIYAGLDFYDVEVKENIKQLNLFTIMKKIKQCISFNRFETIHNINNEVMLRSLHRLFEPIFPSRIRGAEKTSWDYI